VYKYLKGGCKEGRARLLSLVFRGGTRGNRHKLKHWRFPLNLGKRFFTVKVTKNWHRFPREVVESASLKILKRCLEVVLSNRL